MAVSSVEWSVLRKMTPPALTGLSGATLHFRKITEDGVRRRRQVGTLRIANHEAPDQPEACSWPVGFRLADMEPALHRIGFRPNTPTHTAHWRLALRVDLQNEGTDAAVRVRNTLARAEEPAVQDPAVVEPMIVVESLHKTFGTFEAVRHVSFAVPRGGGP